MNDLQIFTNPMFGQVRTITEGGKTLFCGADIAKPLAYTRPSEAVARHCKGTLKRRILTNGGEQEMLFITEGDVYRLIGNLAKLLKQNGVENMGQNRLFDWMRKNGYLIRRKGTDYNMPTQRSMEMGLFRVKETTVVHSDGHVSVNKTSKVTGKGQRYFINLFLSGKRQGK